MTMTMNRALMLAMTNTTGPREISCARMNGECGDIVSRLGAEAWVVSTDDSLVCPFGGINMAAAEALLNSLERSTVI